MVKLNKWLNGKKTIIGTLAGVSLIAFLEARGLNPGTMSDAAVWEQVVTWTLGALSGTFIPVGLGHKIRKLVKEMRELEWEGKDGEGDDK